MRRKAPNSSVEGMVDVSNEIMVFVQIKDLAGVRIGSFEHYERFASSFSQVHSQARHFWHLDVPSSTLGRHAPTTKIGKAPSFTYERDAPPNFCSGQSGLEMSFICCSIESRFDYGSPIQGSTCEARSGLCGGRLVAVFRARARLAASKLTPELSPCLCGLFGNFLPFL